MGADGVSIASGCAVGKQVSLFGYLAGGEEKSVITVEAFRASIERISEKLNSRSGRFVFRQPVLLPGGTASHDQWSSDGRLPRRRLSRGWTPRRRPPLPLR